ncbi:hypothetical protein SKAU_G00272550 [Synaphobranchus kaupii]|uniref:Acetyl-CoA carboxylase central domain-containing protein n=1 Tax=Synaphobranchus kaupii TaxID=118154 RepID=A0A9Q1F0M9_SYNKA|nr:hypothetical protein SKAU_G00272550 [Synaphobranchus kaupii]
MYGHQFCIENLQKLILSETSIFDVLPNFFYHSNQVVRMAALEVYVRRAVHRLRAEQRPAPAAEGQHLHRGVPVHAALLPPQQREHPNSKQNVLLLQPEPLRNGARGPA